MEIALLIVAFAHVAMFVCRGGMPVMVAPASSCYVAPRVLIFPLLVAAMLIGAYLLTGDVAVMMNIDTEELFIAFTAAVVAYAATRSISRHISRLYLIIVALEGSEFMFDDSVTFGWHHFVGWIISPVISLQLAVLIYKVLASIVQGMESRYLNFLQGLGVVNSIATLLLFMAVGINIGGELRSLFVDWQQMVAILGVAGLVLLMAGYGKMQYISTLREREFDINPLVALSVIVATSITILFFSFEATTSLIGVEPTMISPIVLIIASLIGCSRSQGRNVMSGDEVVRIGTANVVALLTAMLAGYLLTAVVEGSFAGGDNMKSILLSVAVVIVALLAITTLQNMHKSRQRALVAHEQAELLEDNRRWMNRLEMEAMQSENENLRNQLALKRREVMSVAMNITEQKEFIEHLYAELKAIRVEADSTERDRLIDNLHTELSLRMNFASEIDSFYIEVEQLHKDFSTRLAEKFPDLTPQERRLTILLRLDFSTKYIATLMNISPKSVEVSRHRLRTKLGLQRQQNLTQFIKMI